MPLFPRFLAAIVAMFAGAAACAQSPAAEDQLAQLLVALIQPAGPYPTASDWRKIETLPGVRWEAAPARMLDKALPDGNYFLRRGTTSIAGRPFAVMATGARATVFNLYFRNLGAELGDEAPVAALERQGYAVRLARCPIRPSPAAASNWWRLEHPEKQPAHFQSQRSCNGRRCEGFALLLAPQLPPLTPRAEALFTDQCQEERPAGPRADSPETPD